MHNGYIGEEKQQKCKIICRRIQILAKKVVTLYANRKRYRWRMPKSQKCVGKTKLYELFMVTVTTKEDLKKVIETKEDQIIIKED